MQSWVHVVEHAAREWPDIVALRDTHGHELTYSQLAHRMERVAGGWQARGVEPGDRVAVVMRNSTEYVVQVLGLHRAGAIPALINWRLSPAEIGGLFGVFSPVAVVYDPEFDTLVDASGIDNRVTTAPGTPDSVDSLDAEPSRPVDRLVGSATFLIIHTSGTTGLPKGVPLTNGAHILGAFLNRSIMRPRPPGTVHLRVLPLFHLAGISGALAVMLGGDTVLLPDRFDPDEFLDTIERERVAVLSLGPSLVRRVCDAQEARQRDVSSLEEVWYGTEAMPPDVLERGLRTLQCGFGQYYGMTEAQRPVSVLSLADHDVGHPHLNSAGRLMPGWEARIVDADDDDVPPGEAGELWVRGESMFPGYWANDDATSARFVGPTHTQGLAWYRTGDVAAMRDGYLYILDRVDDMIISGGENVYPAEVEAAVRTNPDVSDVAVVGMPSERWGQTVHAVVVRRPGSGIDEASLIESCRRVLAHFKCPTGVDFVDELPRNATGKVMRRHVRSALQQGRVPAGRP